MHDTQYVINYTNLKFQRTYWDDYQEFVPIVDDSEKLLPENPAQLASHRRKKPLLLGTTKDESALSLGE